MTAIVEVLAALMLLIAAASQAPSDPEPAPAAPSAASATTTTSAPSPTVVVETDRATVVTDEASLGDNDPALLDVEAWRCTDPTTGASLVLDGFSVTFDPATSDDCEPT